MVAATDLAVDYGWDYPPGMTSHDIARMLGDLPLHCVECEHVIVSSAECENADCWDTAAPYAVDHCDKCCYRHEAEQVA